MVFSIRVPVESSILIWGRETAGYSVEDAASKIGMAPAKLASAEAGKVQLTFAQLKKAADVYKRPLATFFLEEPPPIPEIIHDFRLSPDFSHRPFSPRLNVEIRRAREHRDEALQLATELGETLPPFEHRAEQQEGAEVVAARVRQLLGVTLESQFRWADNHAALKDWKRAVESQEVLVFETSRIDVEEMRGVSIPSDALPVIVLNGGDSRAGRTFTLLHEFAHLLLRRGGVCDLALVDTTTADARTEAFCNAVAASVLAPADALRSKLHAANARDWDMRELGELSDAFRVSKEVILRRLLTLGLTSERHYSRMREEFVREYQEIRLKKTGSKGGPSPAVMAVRNLGRPFVGLVLDAYASDRISLSAVSSYLGIKLKHLSRVEDLIATNEVAA